MIPVKFRIKNYKSIVDSGDCYFSDKLTILAGKNESGKSSILEALEDFGEYKPIRSEAKPINGDGIPEISVSFSISSEIINDIFEELESDKSVSGDNIITFVKFAETEEYVLDPESRNLLNIPDVYDQSIQTVKVSIEKMNDLIKKSGGDVELPKLSKQSLAEYVTEVESFVEQNPAYINATSEIQTIKEAADNFYAQEKLVAKFIHEVVESYLPYFVLFSSFDDEFPESIPIASLDTNAWARALESVSTFSIKRMTSTNRQELANHEKNVNIDFSEKFDKYWTQDKIKLEVKKDGLDINFWIVEKDQLYYPSQRSKGQQWYLSFYVNIVAKLKEDRPNIILIDEPGLYLHAKAQKDLLGVLLAHTNDNPVVFSTHSPYLITEDNLENIRLIEKADSGTKILGKIHAHPTADRETLTPILTAIGLGVNDSITNLDQKNNVIVEGPEDVFYLQAFKFLENNDLKASFISGGGSSNMGIVGAVLEGWGANVVYLFDNDQGKRDGVKRLKAWKINPDLVKTVLTEDNTAIVDIFSISDFKKFVLEDTSLTYTTSNSEYIKGVTPKPDKVLLARNFLQNAKAGKISLDSETKKKIKNLFTEIEF